MLVRTALCAAIVFALPAALSSQGDSTATIRGIARSSFNGRPLAGVMISVPAIKQFAVTDSTGVFALSRIPAGRQHVRVSYEGRNTEEFQLDLKRGKTKRLAVMLDIEALDLAPIVVEAQNPDFARNLAGFYDRKKWYSGFARFYTREELDRRHAPGISQLLNVDGIFTRCVSRGCIPVRWSRGALCAVAVSVDGMPFWEQDYDHIVMDEVQAVEVYRSAFGASVSGITMAVANPRDPVERAGTCGSVMIWTR